MSLGYNNTMSINRPSLTSSIEEIVLQQGGQAEFDGQQGPYVVMTWQKYCDLLDPEFVASIKAIREGLADAEAGRTVSAEKFFAELRQADDV